MDKFIYVFGLEERDKLLKIGLRLIKSDDINHTFVFINEPASNFAELKDIVHVTSNTLTF